MDEKRVMKIVKNILPSVVSIAIAEHIEDLENTIPEGTECSDNGNGDTSKENQKPKIPEEMIDSHGMVTIGGGSGFIVAKDGLILTNKHVVNDPKAEYTVILSDNRSFPARILSRDPINDVAILKIEATGLPCLPLGDATKLQLGQSLVAVGNALGIFRNTVSLGIVSGLSRSITAQADPGSPPQEMRGLIQTDAAINPGNSGGPIVDSDGRVVGVNAAIVSGAQSIGFAIPVNAARRDIEDIKKYGRIRRPLLGIRYIMIDKDLKEKADLPVDYGALAIRESQHDSAVVPGSPADKAGIKEKDIILALNAKRLDHEHPIQDLLDDLNVGDKVELLILRGQERFTREMCLEERM